ncbi:MAG: hypothetical protein HYY06_32355 [Deltaproteobacteria bacterium]|nr:hypothetical protein [Deltaproteobacteria bacterium]
MHGAWQRWSLACALGALVAPVAAWAQPRSEPPSGGDARSEATVVRLDGADMLVDVGSASGARVGSAFQLFRSITVRHPATGRMLRDRFRIGTIELRSVGESLSIARPIDDLMRAPAVGDIVVPISTEPSPPHPAPAPPPVVAPPIVSPGPPPRPASGAPRLVVPASSHAAPSPVTPGPSREEQVWLATIGRPPEQRIELYLQFLGQNPTSPHAARVRDEIEYLRTSLPPIAAAGIAAPASPAMPRLHGAPAETLRTGDPAVLAFQIDGGRESPYRNGLLYVRRQGEPVYRHLRLGADGDGYLRARIPSLMAAAPGYEYFVDVTDAEGRAIPAWGSATEPVAVAVEPPPGPPEAVASRSRVDLSAEWADVGSGTFDGVGRPEHFSLVEGHFLQRVDWGPLYGYRVGFGVYDGVGQPLEAYEKGSGIEPASSTVIYGYHELEVAASDFVHLMMRVEVGMHDEGIVGGGQGRIRIGSERATNIVVGGDIMDEVGQRAFFAFNFFPAEQVPVLTQGEVFNQSIDGGDPMFRLVSQVGYRLAKAATVSARGSYQLRNIKHGGFGGGLSLTFDW